MKTPISQFSALTCAFVLAISLSGCNLFDKADDISFTTSLAQSIAVDENDAAENVTYEASVLMDAKADTEVEKYKEKINSIQVTKVTYKILNYSGGEILVSTAKLSFGDSDGTPATIIASIGSLNLHDAYTNGTEFELTLQQTDLNKLNALLKADKEVKVYASGSLSSTPVSFDVEVTLDMKITANAL